MLPEVEEALRLVTGNERSASPARIATGRPEGAGAAAVATPIGGAMKILPIERLNAILVVTPLKIVQGTGSPIRALALVPGA